MTTPAAILQRYFRLPTHAPLLPFEVAALVRDVFEAAARRNASDEVRALAHRIGDQR